MPNANGPTLCIHTEKIKRLPLIRKSVGWFALETFILNQYRLSSSSSTCVSYIEHWNHLRSSHFDSHWMYKFRLYTMECLRSARFDCCCYVLHRKQMNLTMTHMLLFFLYLQSQWDGNVPRRWRCGDLMSRRVFVIFIIWLFRMEVQ